MSYKAIYRRFRPKSFEDLVGQEHISTILKNQIKTDNIAHAYLFSGIRGTGKTSAAKIFARAVNCTSPIDGDPCNKCEICLASLDESLMDIVEIDAASNNKVEDIRELRESINYPPSKGRYKVYIVDEVHMLSTSAFNAFLKTLEEPPSYVIFILATTEQQKIPATIVSRCQRYEFKRISSEDISKNMAKICSELDIEVEDRTLRLIARNSEGAMRDALSILDQVVAISDGKIEYEEVLDSLGSVNGEVLVSLVDSLIQRDASELFEKIEKIIKSGKDPIRLLKDMITFFRSMVIVKSGANYREILDEPDEVLDEIEKKSGKIEMDRLMDCIDVMSEAESTMKYATQPRITLEITAMKLLEAGEREKLISRIEKLENIINSGKIEISRDAKPEGREKRTPEREVKKEKVQAEEDGWKKEAELSSKDIAFNDILEEWPEALKYVKKKKIALHALLVEGKVVKFKNGVLTIQFGDQFGFHKDAIEKEHNKKAVEEILADYFKSSLAVNFTMEDERGPEEDGEDLLQGVVEIFGSEKLKIED